MLKVKHIHKSYGKQAILEDISFNIESGTIVGLVGENGAGKSTLINIIASLLKPDQGSVMLDNLDFRKNEKLFRQSIGYIPQDISIWDHFTVRENMIFFTKLSSVNKSEEDLEQLCLDLKLNKWEERVDTLSGGQKRKLNMALSLIHDPKLLLLDEPTVGIDMKSKAEIVQFIKDRVYKNEMIALYTSHDIAEIEELCDHIICIGNDPFYHNLLQDSDKTIVSFK